MSLKQSPSCQCSWIRFYANCHSLTTSHFSGTEFWQIAETVARLAIVETNFIFYIDVLQKFMYDGPKSITKIDENSGNINDVDYLGNGA
jgi:hypothetical protein